MPLPCPLTFKLIKIEPSNRKILLSKKLSPGQILIPPKHTLLFGLLQSIPLTVPMNKEVEQWRVEMKLIYWVRAPWIHDHKEEVEVEALYRGQSFPSRVFFPVIQVDQFCQIYFPFSVPGKS